MAHYQRAGDVPPKRHTQHRDPDGNLYYEELMGEEGFSSDSSLLYHRHVPSALVDARTWELPDQATEPNAPAHAAAPDAARPVPRRRVAGPSTRSPAAGWCSATPTCGSATPSSARPRRSTATPSATSASSSRAVRRRVETVFGDLEVGTGDYVVLPRATTHRWVPTSAGRAAAALRDRGEQPHRAAEALPVALRPVPRARAVLRARPAAADRAARCGRRRDVEVYVKHRGTGPGGLAGTVHVVPAAPVRRRRLGRLPLPLRVQRRRLRADHRPGAPAAAGAPGLRGPQLRDLQLRAAQGRLPPARRAGAVLPLQRRQRRGHVLRRRRLRGAQGLRHRRSARSRCTPAGTPTARSRARSRRSLGAE